MFRVELRDEEAGRRFWRQLKHPREVEALIARERQAHDQWIHHGWCDMCGKASRFTCDWKFAEQDSPNFRERLFCKVCGLNVRLRLVARMIRESLEAKAGAGEQRVPRLYLYEQVTPLYRGLSELAGVELVGSEYLGHDVVPGTYQGGIRHEDALHLSFPDGGFDLVVSNDVYEHVPDIQLALAEACRVLRPGGTLIATLPFHYGPTTLQRARLVGGAVEHLEPPQYHENPVSEAGSLVFYDFGWDLLDLCRASGFGDARFVGVHSFFHAYLGIGAFVLEATR